MDALSAKRQAVDIYERLARENPRAHEPNLAKALAQLSAQLLRRGDYEEASSASERAGEIYSRLTKENPSKYEPEFAAVLVNLCAGMLNSGRVKESVRVGEVAVALCWKLAEGDPATYEPILAGALTNCARARVRARIPSGEKYAEKALEIYTRLLPMDRDKYEDPATQAVHVLAMAREGEERGTKIFEDAAKRVRGESGSARRKRRGMRRFLPPRRSS